jgi:hypothetical protein
MKKCCWEEKKEMCETTTLSAEIEKRMDIRVSNYEKM